MALKPPPLAVVVYLPNLAKLTEEEYNNAFVGRVKTGIPYEIFYRNASSALKNASKTD